MNRATLSFRNRRTTGGQRAKLLAAFDRSGLSAAAFARKHQITYTTFCGWRQRRDKNANSLGFVQVELPSPVPSTDLVIELGSDLRIRLGSGSHIELAAALVARIRKEMAC